MKTQKKKTRWYVIEPLCHGNGGWYGSKIWKRFTTLKQALRSRPNWEAEWSPYGGGIINNPRLSQTQDINDAQYIFKFDTMEWIKI